MEQVISFPKFGIEFTVNRVATTLFGKDIYWYGIIICAGFLLAALYLRLRVKKFGLTPDHLIDCMIIGVPFGIVGARAYYVIFEWDYYSQHLDEIIKVWRGGIAIYGAVIGVVIGLWLYSRFKKLSFANLCDVASIGLILGQGIGRWGNFINGEAHGTRTTLPWGMVIDGSSTYHPTFLYESIWDLVGFVLLHFRSKKRWFEGEIALLYVAWYGLGRAWIEGLRTDSLYLGPVRISQVLAIISCIAAVIILVRKYQRISVARKFYVPQPKPVEEPAESEAPAEADAKDKAEADAKSEAVSAEAKEEQAEEDQASSDGDAPADESDKADQAE